MNIDELKEVAQLMRDYDLSEFSIEADGCNVSMRRGAGASSAPVVVAAPMPATAAPVAPVVASENVAAAEETKDVAAEEKTIDSPLVGTFYSASAPGAKPFISVGDTISPDMVIGLIEAMKVMNEVKAEKGGVVLKILVENGQAVEFGQPLVVIG